MENKQPEMLTIDGNQAAAIIAHLCNEVIAIYPITPASPMGEWADEWSSKGQKNLWGMVPQVIEMQSEAGAAGAIHGALQAGSLTTTFTASQGLLLMLPNMYKIAGELSPTVFHIAARSLACQALSIFGDHSDVMSARSTGFAMLASNSPQEVMDMALISQAATLKGRIPLLHFFDGFRTSHEMAKLDAIDTDTVQAMIDMKAIDAHRDRAMSPFNPVLRGSSQNPDVYFQARESVNRFYREFPGIVQQTMLQFEELTGRSYKLYEYVGDEQAERIVILMGSGAETAHETVDYLNKQGEKTGVLKVRLYRPLDTQTLLEAIPQSVKGIAVLDRTKEPGADGEPLYKDIVTAFAQCLTEPQARFDKMPRIIGGRYGLSSKEFTPAMVKAVFDQLTVENPKNHFTIGINDDVTNTSLQWDEHYKTDANDDTFQAVFYGLGSDGTVSANKNSIKIIGESTELKAQGYFVYDSKKSGAVTVSHLRFGPHTIRSTYLIGDNEADFVACHQSVFLQRFNMLDHAADNAVFLINTSQAPDQVWYSLPRRMQKQCIDKHIRLYAIDAYAVAEQAGMGKRINTIMQTCFFAISGVLPQQQAIDAIKQAVVKTYGKKGQRIIDINFCAIDKTLANLNPVEIPATVNSQFEISHAISADAPEFVHKVTVPIIAGNGDQLPVSVFPVDGTFPTGTAAYEKRNIALEIPVWENDICTQCGKCPLVCPHAAIRSKIFHQDELANSPAEFKTMPIKGKDFPKDYHISYQVAAEDCTGCGLCVDICPIRDKSNASRKALNMKPIEPLLDQERENWQFFLGLSEYDRRKLKTSTIKGVMVLEPLFEFSGACSGCGETPYVKLASQLFGDRMLVANATGCSSIYGGNLPTTPWTKNKDGLGPSWNNSLFEDNAEFGLGLRVAVDKHRQQAEALLQQLKPQLDQELVEQLLHANESDETGIHEQRERVKQLGEQLEKLTGDLPTRLNSMKHYLCRQSVWIMGGDGWAYDIGYGGLDHVMASGSDVNILVLDTEVYSNTGGQTSKATPRGAVAKFSSGGKATGKKDLAMQAIDYEDVYVAHVAYGAKDIQTVRTFIEAEAHDGPSLIIAYSPCIAHGVDMSNNHRQQQMAVKSGHWPLFRYNPQKARLGQNPLHMDSPEPSIPYREYIMTETRFNMLWHTHPQDAEAFLQRAQQDVTHRYHYYQQLSELEWDHQTTMKSAKAKLASAIDKKQEK